MGHLEFQEEAKVGDCKNCTNSSFDMFFPNVFLHKRFGFAQVRYTTSKNLKIDFDQCFFGNVKKNQRKDQMFLSKFDPYLCQDQQETP